jgi:hypothetical protein
MSIAERLSNLTIKNDGFLFDSTTGDTYVANPTALTMLRWIQDGSDEHQVTEEAVRRFDAGEHEIRRDVADLMSRLRSWQLL